MTIIFSPSTKNLFLGRGILNAFSNPCSISIYSGTQPTSADVTSNWGAYSSGGTNFLAHYLNASWTQPAEGLLMQLGIPPATAPINTDTASWCILWCTAVTPAQVLAGTLPHASFIVGACSDGVGKGLIRFNDLSFTAGTFKTMLDGSISIA